MNFEKHKINITLNKLDYSFYYSFNNDSTFLDLLEYFAYLVPSLKLCECYQFQSTKDKTNFDEECLLISHNSKIADFRENLINLVIKKIPNKCVHYRSKFLCYSKKAIINYYEN